MARCLGWSYYSWCGRGPRPSPSIAKSEAGGFDAIGGLAEVRARGLLGKVACSRKLPPMAIATSPARGRDSEARSRMTGLRSLLWWPTAMTKD